MRTTSTFVLLATFVFGSSIPTQASFTGDREQVALTRSAASSLELSAQLSRDEYRYEEQVETYTEQVPYTVEVPYEDVETFYTQETRCENVSRTVPVCHEQRKCEQVPRHECHQETKCFSSIFSTRSVSLAALGLELLRAEIAMAARPAPRDRSEPSRPAPRDRSDDRPSRPAPRDRDDDRPSPRPAPAPRDRDDDRPSPRPAPVPRDRDDRGNGGGNHGGGGGSDHDRDRDRCRSIEVCHDRIETRCDNVPVCHNETRIERECSTVSVPHTRVVTRIRTETHFRPEQRTRIVTVPVFDHSWGVAVNVVMPEQSGLQADETETVFVSLKGSEFEPDADVRVESQIFNYRIAGKERSGNQITIRLELVARYAPGDLGARTISGLLLESNAAAKFIRFRDVGLAARTATRYKISLFDLDAGRNVFEKEVAGQIGAPDVMIPLDVQVADDHDHIIRLNVSREGIVLAAPEAFQLEELQLVQLDAKPYLDPNGVREFSIIGARAGAQLVFTDITPHDGKVDTLYDVTLKKRTLGFLWKRTIAKGSFSRSLLKNEGTKVSLSLALFVHLKKDQLDELFESFDPGDDIYVEIAVKRESPRLKGHSPVTFKKSAKVHVKEIRRGH